MLDDTATIPTTALSQHICPGCAKEFDPKRRNQRYCARACQKSATNNAARAPRRVAESAEARRRNECRNRRRWDLTHALYSAPPAYRAEFLLKLVVEARQKKELRQWVTERQLLHCIHRDEGTGRLNIVHVLDHFCCEVFGLRSFEVLAPNRSLPEEHELAFPAAYFGPDALSVYEAGSLKRRPCPWRYPRERSMKSAPRSTNRVSLSSVNLAATLEVRPNLCGIARSRRTNLTTCPHSSASRHADESALHHYKEGLIAAPCSLR